LTQQLLKYSQQLCTLYESTRKSLCNIVQRQYKITYPNATQEDIDNIGEKDIGNVVFYQDLLNQQLDQQTLQQVTERHLELLQLEKFIKVKNKYDVLFIILFVFFSISLSISSSYLLIYFIYIYISFGN